MRSSVFPLCFSRLDFWRSFWASSLSCLTRPLSCHQETYRMLRSLCGARYTLYKVKILFCLGDINFSQPNLFYICVLSEFSSAGCVCGIEEFSASETHHSDSALDSGVSVHAGSHWPTSSFLQDCFVPSAPDLQVSSWHIRQIWSLHVIVLLIMVMCVCQEDVIGSRRGAVLHESAAHGGSFGLALPGEISQVRLQNWLKLCKKYLNVQSCQTAEHSYVRHTSWNKNGWCDS